MVVAFSAGSDSTATLKILRWAGFDAIPIMAKLPQMGGEDVLARAKEWGGRFSLMCPVTWTKWRPR